MRARDRGWCPVRHEAFASRCSRPGGACRFGALQKRQGTGEVLAALVPCRKGRALGRAAPRHQRAQRVGKAWAWDARIRDDEHARGHMDQTSAISHIHGPLPLPTSMVLYHFSHPWSSTTSHIHGSDLYHFSHPWSSTTSHIHGSDLYHFPHPWSSCTALQLFLEHILPLACSTGRDALAFTSMKGQARLV